MLFQKYIYLFIFGCLGLCCCALAFSSGGEWGLLSNCVGELLIAVASLAERRLWSMHSAVAVMGLAARCPGPGFEPKFPALETGFLTTGLPGKSNLYAFDFCVHFYTKASSPHVEQGLPTAIGERFSNIFQNHIHFPALKVAAASFWCYLHDS